MNGHVEVEIGGVKRVLMFNNFAREEVSKQLGIDDVNPEILLGAIQKLSEQNHLLLLKILVFAGHCGYCYRVQNHTELTMSDIGAWVADVGNDEMLRVWHVFLQSEGFGLPEDPAPVGKKVKKKH